MSHFVQCIFLGLSGLIILQKFLAQKLNYKQEKVAKCIQLILLFIWRGRIWRDGYYLSFNCVNNVFMYFGNLQHLIYIYFCGQI